MLAFLAVQFVAQFLVVAIYSLVNGQVSDDLPPMWDIATMVLFSVVSIVLFLKMCWAEASRSYLQSRPWDVLLWSVVASLGAIVPSLLLQGLIPEWTGWAKDIVDQTNQQLEGLMSIPGGYMVIALLPPVVEELVFRGAVLRALLRWHKNAWVGIAISAALFAIIHVNPAQMPHAFLAGLLLGWMYYRTDSIVPGVVFHWVNNSVAYVLYNLYPDPSLKLIDILGGQQQSVWMALVFSLLIFLPALFQMNLRLKK